MGLAIFKDLRTRMTYLILGKGSMRSQGNMMILSTKLEQLLGCLLTIEGICASLLTKIVEKLSILQILQVIMFINGIMKIILLVSFGYLLVKIKFLFNVKKQSNT